MKFRIVKGIAGSFILISLLLTHFVHSNWVWMTVFVGVNLLQSSITKWCLLEVILDKLGVSEGKKDSCCS
ncbi:MAG: YgaP family membrane protein [Flavobacteriales bacterium]